MNLIKKIAIGLLSLIVFSIANTGLMYVFCMAVGVVVLFLRWMAR